MKSAGKTKVGWSYR